MAEEVRKEAEEPKKEVVSATPAEWIKQNLDIRHLTLPSGVIFKVKNVDMQTMLTRGYVKTSLLNSLISAQYKILKNKEKNPDKIMQGVERGELKEIDSLCRSFAIVAVVEPKITAEKESSEESINVNDMSFEDCLFIFHECVRGGADYFAPFLPEGASRIDAGHGGSEVRKATIGDGGDKG